MLQIGQGGSPPLNGCDVDRLERFWVLHSEEGRASQAAVQRVVGAKGANEGSFAQATPEERIRKAASVLPEKKLVGGTRPVTEF